MRRLLLILVACTCSVALQLLFASLCPVPRSDLFIDVLMHVKLARAAMIGDRPKLVVLAGSNGLFSHRCQVMEPVLGLPCVNASIAVGVGLDYIFARWRPVLHPGDVVYMPMEGPQFTRSRAANRVGPETRLMVRNDWHTLAELPLDRQLAAALSVDVLSALRDLLTTPPGAPYVADLYEVIDKQYNAWGDRIHHTAATADGVLGELDTEHGSEPTAREIERGYGAALIGGFVRWAVAHGVLVIGGLATDFSDIPLSPATLAAEQAIFTGSGGRFLVLSNESRYPRHDFYDARYHLYEACQIRHSILIAEALAPMLGRTPRPAPPWTTAVTCPNMNDVAYPPGEDRGSVD